MKYIRAHRTFKGRQVNFAAATRVRGLATVWLAGSSHGSAAQEDVLGFVVDQVQRDNRRSPSRRSAELSQQVGPRRVQQVVGLQAAQRIEQARPAAGLSTMATTTARFSATSGDGAIELST